ncbi:hypothetical protein [uncultured Bradyrhizobium sp.]|jgi:hypothetical protein|uniref:hypothetical protein n=1 Tax=uncultured Bradyrhizobium sp. TaxID=199684 RepID=UPI00260EA65A|nr:hypothetical protein [uncultured Bradyrhizobium sp.]
MLPEIVTFWHGPMDALRQTCLRSQLAAGHKVTVYSFDTIPGLPAGVENADAEAILPHAFSERLRPPQTDGSWRDWTTLQFSDFFRMKLMARNLGLWLDADVLLLKPVEIDPAKPYFAWERSRRLGNSVLYLPQKHQIVGAFEDLMEQEELTPEWLSLSHRLSFAIKRLGGGSQRLSDLRIAIFGPPALTILARRSGDLPRALPKRSFYAVHSEPKLFFDPSSYLGIVTDPNVIGLHISGKGRSLQPPVPGSLYAWAVERFA